MKPLTRQEVAIITNESKISVGRGYFDYVDHNDSVFNIEDIATSLSNICRYTGHLLPGKFYSVAEHCVNVSYVVPSFCAFEGLMHDAPEAFIGDVNSVLKQYIGPAYKELDKSVSAFLADRFGYSYPYPKEVKGADGRMYRTEAPQITANNDKFWLLDFEPYPIRIECWKADKAKRKFLERFYELKAKNELINGQREKTDTSEELRIERTA